jgi:tetratricopeptide (TPR) repeat protein
VTAPTERTSGLRRLLVAVALGAPACAGLFVAGSLWSAAVAIGGFGPGGEQHSDPLLSLVLHGSVAPEAAPDHAKAARLAPLDHRYAYRAARSRLFPASGVLSGADRVEAFVLLSRAARLAPSDAVVRLLMFQVAAALGREELATEQALAAVALAPLNLHLKRQAARYFEDRYLRHGSRVDLSRAIGTREGDLLATLALVRDDATLSYEEVAAAFISAGVDREWAVEALLTAGRQDWAVRFGLDFTVEGPSRARARLARGSARLAAGDGPGAREDVEEARRLQGKSFADHGLLGEARLAAGDVEGGFAALLAALASGEEARSISARIDRAGTSGAATAFWDRAARSGRPAEILERSEVLLRAGRGMESAEPLRGLLDLPGFSGRANYLMARVLLEAGKPAMAKRYARAAVAADPRSAEYAELLRGIGD